MALCVLVSLSYGQMVTVTDDFSGATLNPLWVVDDHIDNYASGGGFVKAADHLRFNSIFSGAYGHIETSVPAFDTLRIDAVLRQDHYPTSTWGMGVGIYFDEGNWVSLKQGAAGGQNGWMADVMVDGVLNSTMGNVVYTLRVVWLIQGVELTETEIIFYGSPICCPTPADQFDQTDIDGNVSEIAEFRMSRPTSFTGPATVIIGKGFTGQTYPGGTLWSNPDFDNNISTSLDGAGFAGIDFARLTYNEITGPQYCGDDGTVYLSADINQDCYVEWADFGQFASQWQQCTDPANTTCNQYWGGSRFLYIWPIDPYRNILRTASPGLTTPRLDSITVEMARGEYRDAVFMVGPPAQDTTISVDVESATLPADAVLTQETLYLPNRAGEETADAIYPLTNDLLVPAGQSRQIRLRFDARYSGLAAGSYTFDVRITNADEPEQSYTIPGELTVWDFELPSNDILPNNSYAEFNTGQFNAGSALASAVTEMKKYGLNMIYVHPLEMATVPDVDNDGTVLTYDDSALQWRIYNVQQIWDSLPGNDKLYWIFSLSGLTDLGMTRTDITFLSPLWHTVLGQYVAALRATLVDRGVADDEWFLTLGDEAYADRLQNIEIPFAEAIKQADSTIQLLNNSSVMLTDPQWSQRYFDSFDIFQPSLRWGIEPNPDLLPWLKTSGKTIWTYDAMSDWGVTGKNVYEYYRTYAWKMVQHDITGIGIWTSVAQGFDPWGATPNLGNILLFKHWAGNDAVHCRRYEMYRETVDDYRYIWKLREIAVQAGSTAVQETEQLLQQAIADITADVTDTTRCDYWRKQIAHKIIELTP